MTFFRRVADRARDRGGEGSEPSQGPRYLFVARFSAADAMLLRELVSQIAELVGGPSPVDSGTQAGHGTEAGSGTQVGEMAGVTGDLADVLGLTEDAGLPDDPALARLLPDAYTDDCEASSEFRRYTEKDLRAGKVAAAKTVLATLPEGGGRISLSQSQAQVWLRALNDIRLALGVRLGVTEDMNEEMDRIRRDDPRYGVLAVYDWLSGTQESLVHALS